MRLVNSAAPRHLKSEEVLNLSSCSSEHKESIKTLQTLDYYKS